MTAIPDPTSQEDEGYPLWLVDLVRAFIPRVVPLDVTPEGTYEEATTRWGPNPVYAAVPADLRALAERKG